VITCRSAAQLLDFLADIRTSGCAPSDKPIAAAPASAELDARLIAAR